MTLADIGHRKVCAVMRDGSEATELLCHAAMRGKVDWTLAQWNAVLAELDACQHKVRDWLQLQD